SSTAAAPATCGVAIDVPDSVLVAVEPVYQSETMPEPGANTSTQVPTLEYEARASVRSLAATVSAAAARAGDCVHASTLSLPAATETVTPSSTSAVIAASRLLLVAPPRLRLATAGVPAAWSAAAQSSPAMTPDMLPDPLQ